MHRRRAFSIGSLAILVLSVSCSGVHKLTGMLQDALVVQVKLVKALEYNDIRVNSINGQFLSVGVVNSPLHDLPAEQKKAKALAIARLAYNACPCRSELKGVSVAFAVHRSYLLGLFNYDNSTDAFNFEVPSLLSERTPQ